MNCNVLILAGLWNSGPQHWQTLWEHKHPNWVRVQHRDWNNPNCHEWVAELDAAIGACEGPPLLVAHSLGTMLVAQWARSGSDLKIAGAFMVAPCDVEAQAYPVDPNGFAPVPMEKLAFPSMVLASSDDPFVEIDRAQQIAQAWGSRFVEIGSVGHVNGEAGLGEWQQGEKLLEEFCAEIAK